MIKDYAAFEKNTIETYKKGKLPFFLEIFFI